MFERLQFATKEMTYLGRNGLGKMYGLDMYDSTSLSEGPFIYLAPVNSRGDTGRCSMRIPIASIPELVGALNKFYEVNRNVDLPGSRGPVTPPQA